MSSLSCRGTMGQSGLPLELGIPSRLRCCQQYWNPPPLGSGVHTLLCTSQGLVMAERSQAVIIMALGTGHHPSVQSHLRLYVLVNSIHLFFLSPNQYVTSPHREEGGHFPSISEVGL